MGIGDKMFKGIAWSAIERLSIQTIQFFIQIALARILTPAEYGVIGILYVFIAICFVFIDSGFTKALIQKKNRTQEDISTVFWFNIILSIVAYLILFFIAPIISDFYEIKELSILLRVLSFSLILNALFTVPVTLYTIKMDFKTLTKINFFAAVISGSIAYSMALKGYGVWALVGLTISRSLISLILTWFMISWKPIWVFSKNSLKELFSFGSNLLVSSLLNVTVNKAYELVIPKTNSIQDLGYYTRGTQFTDSVFAIINAIFERVLLPGLTEVQDQIELLTIHTRSIIKSASLFVVPIFLYLAVIAEPLIRMLIGEKWLPAVPIMQIFCLARLITIISSININLLYVIGRSDLALKQQYIKIAVRVVFLLIAINYGIFYIALAELASTIVHFGINTYYPGKIMKYGASKQVKDILPILVATIFMSISVLCVLYYIENDWLKLIVAPLVAFPIYFGFIRLFKVTELDRIVIKVKSLIKK